MCYLWLCHSIDEQKEQEMKQEIHKGKDRKEKKCKTSLFGFFEFLGFAEKKRRRKKKKGKLGEEEASLTH